MSEAANIKRRKRVNFSSNEDKLITELHGEHGDYWTQIAEKFNQIKPNDLFLQYTIGGKII